MISSVKLGLADRYTIQLKSYYCHSIITYKALQSKALAEQLFAIAREEHAYYSLGVNRINNVSWKDRTPPRTLHYRESTETEQWLSLATMGIRRVGKGGHLSLWILGMFY